MVKSDSVKQPMPKEGFSVSYICRYESEIDRQIILDSMGHYIENVLGTREILFVKVPMEAINKAFKLNLNFPGEEVEFTIDYMRNNVVRYKELAGDELPPLWAVLSNEAANLDIIATIEPCKFIVRTDALPAFELLMSQTEIAPKEYDYSALDSVQWNSTTLALKRDIEFFITGKKKFDSRDIPYSRSYLLHGPPGNGKTTTIKAIAKFLNAKVETFDFSANMTSPDSQFQSWVLGESERIARESEDDDYDGPTSARTPIRLLVLEDIDRLFPKNGGKQTQVTLQAVLQALDGAIERRNMIVIATANHPKDLDQQVLARPGRFDKQVFYEQPTPEEGFSYMKRLFAGEDVSDQMLMECCVGLKGYSYAYHKGFFATAASFAVERSSQLIQDIDLKSALDDFKTHVNSVIMKSEKPKMGFPS